MTRSARSTSLTLAVSAAVLAASCSGSDPTTTPASSSVTAEAPTSTDPPPTDSAAEVSTPESTVAPSQPPSTATLEAAECGFAAAGLTEGVDLHCATVATPLGGEGGGDARIFVTMVGSLTPANPDPIVHLPGGPGASSEAYAPVMGSLYLGLATATDRTVVFVDQRGTGRSTPFLTCDDPSDPSGCVDAWAAEGIDPMTITTTAAADDVAAVLAALGAVQANIWGASYGSRLALEVARRHPDVVRSLLIESVDTADTPLDKLAGVTGALGRIGDRCAADATCAALGVDPVVDIDVIAEQLDATPVESAFGSLDGQTFISAVLGLMQDSVGESLVPLFIAAARDANVGAIEAVQTVGATQPPLGGPLSVGMLFVTNCGDLDPFDPQRVIAEQQASATTPLAQMIVAELDAAVGSGCAAWPHATNGPVDPVSSDAPTLVFAGDDDSNTPVENAERALATLSNATLITFPGYGHFPFHRGDNPCPAVIYAAFVTDPSSRPDTSCVSPGSFRTMIGTIEETELTARDLPSIGISIGLPASWLSLVSGGAVAGDGSAVVAQLIPGSVADTQTTLQAAYGLTDPATTPVDVDGTEWMITSGELPVAPGAEATPTDIRYALVEAGPQTLAVIISGSSDDGAALDALLRSILATVTPL